MNIDYAKDIAITVVSILFIVQTLRLSYYKGYYDQKQRNRKMYTVQEEQ